MKKTLIILSLIFVLVVVVVAVGHFSGWFSSSAGPGSVSTPTPIATQPAPTTQTAEPTSTAPTPSAAQPTSTTTAVAPFVQFDFFIADISGSGFTRTVTAQVSNLGNEDAHNVYGEVTVTQGDSTIKINGGQSLIVQIGALPAGTSVTAQQDIKFGLVDGLKIQNSGATFTITIHADEATATFTQFYQP